MQITIPILLNTAPKIENEEIWQKSFYETTITLIPKLDEDTQKIKLLTNFPINVRKGFNIFGHE